MNTLKVGDNAPEFTLKNQNDEDISLSDYEGKKRLIYFYPKASTPGCTVQAKGLRDNLDSFDDKNTIVFGISPDPVTRIAKFVAKENLNFNLLSDTDHAIADAYGVWGLKKFMGKEYDGIHRISFLVDEQGKIAEVFNKFKTKDHHQVVLDSLS